MHQRHLAHLEPRGLGGVTDPGGEVGHPFELLRLAEFALAGEHGLHTVHVELGLPRRRSRVVRHPLPVLMNRVKGPNSSVMVTPRGTPSR